MIIKSDIFSRMISIGTYFETHAKKDTTFQPEANAAKIINKLIGTTQELKKDEVQNMLNIINEVESKEHYNGSGWMDYKMHFSALLKQNGFKIEWGRAKKMELK